MGAREHRAKRTAPPPRHPIVAIPDAEGHTGLRLRMVPASAPDRRPTPPLRLLRVQETSGAAFHLVLGEPRRSHR
ncbi:MAG TPA: hypothetical protein VIP80_03930 [Gemmatimonadales bacterium]